MNTFVVFTPFGVPRAESFLLYLYLLEAYQCLRQQEQEQRAERQRSQHCMGACILLSPQVLMLKLPSLGFPQEWPVTVTAVGRDVHRS